MPNRVRIRADAAGDVHALEAYYATAAPEVAEELRANILDALAAIAERPDSFSMAFADVRRALIRRFHVGVIFHRDVADPDELVVIGVFDLRRDPATWRSRR